MVKTETAEVYEGAEVYQGAVVYEGAQVYEDEPGADLREAEVRRGLPDSGPGGTTCDSHWCMGWIGAGA